MVGDLVRIRQNSPPVILERNNYISSMTNFCSNVEEAGVRITLREPGHPRSLGPKHLNLLNFQSMLGEKLSFQVLKKLGMVVRGGGLNTLDSVANIAKVIK